MSNLFLTQSHSLQHLPAAPNHQKDECWMWFKHCVFKMMNVNFNVIFHGFC